MPRVVETVRKYVLYVHYRIADRQYAEDMRSTTECVLQICRLRFNIELLCDDIIENGQTEAITHVTCMAQLRVDDICDSVVSLRFVSVRFGYPEPVEDDPGFIDIAIIIRYELIHNFAELLYLICVMNDLSIVRNTGGDERR